MRLFARLFVIGTVAIACTVGVRAADDWLNVSLGEDPGLRIDIPAAVGDKFKPSGSDPKSTLMSFSVSIDDLGQASCSLVRFPYDEQTPRDQMITIFGQGKAGVFCQESGKNISHWQLNDSGAVAIDGMPGGQCSAAYMDSESKQPGRVEAVMIVAARTQLYSLSCLNSRDDLGKAISAYEFRWEGVFKHIQQSLHLPASDR